MLGKPIRNLCADDIHYLVRVQTRESDVVEFKEALSGKGGPDGWHNGAPSFSDPARDKIVNEIVAFANAHGGTLILGITETDDKPARADKVVPIQRCADLADRLARALADTVEPPLAPFPVIVPVLIEEDAGVVVFQVAASRNAPHRHRTTLASYIRRGEQAVQMTMREIQDLTLQVERGLAQLEKQFEVSAERFASVCRPSTAFALRATAVPLTPLSIPIPNDTSISPTFESFQGTRGHQKIQAVVPHAPTALRPILRGIRGRERDDYAGGDVSLTVKDNGLLELFLSKGDAEGLTLYAGWFIGLACNTLTIVDYLRRAAGAPGTEFGLELAVYAAGSFHVAAYGGRDYGSAKWNVGSATFPRYSIGERAGFAELIGLIDRDFWNAVGVRTPPPVVMDFGSVD